MHDEKGSSLDISKLSAVEIEINSACNKSCSYCPNSVDERIEKGHMGLELYQEVLSQLQDINFNGRISYDFYNEPLLSPNLSSFTQLTKEKLPNVEIHLYSNGSLLGPEKFKELKKSGISKFIITKHEDHFNQRKPYLFEKTLSMLDEAELEFVEYRDFNNLELTNRAGTLKHIKTQIKDIRTYPCFIPTFMMTITVNGTVLPCFEDFYQRMAMGNIKEQHIRDIWNQPEYVKFRKMLMLGQRASYEICKDCTRTQVMPNGKSS